MFNIFDPYEQERLFYEQKLAEYYIEWLKERQSRKPEQKKNSWLKRFLDFIK